MSYMCPVFIFCQSNYIIILNIPEILLYQNTVIKYFNLCVWQGHTSQTFCKIDMQTRFVFIYLKTFTNKINSELLKY